MEILPVNSEAEGSSGSFQFEEVEFVPDLFRDPELKVTSKPSRNIRTHSLCGETLV